MDDSSESQHAINLTGLRGQTLLHKLDDEPTLRGAPFARGLTDPFVKRTGKRDVLPHMRCHASIVHIEIAALHTIVLGEAINELNPMVGTRGHNPRLPLQLSLWRRYKHAIAPDPGYSGAGAG